MLKSGRSDTKQAWYKMRERCSPNNNRRDLYFDIGIEIDPSWNSFEQFVKDMGERPEGLELDRKDNNKGYSKENCRWATRAQQVQNSSKARLNIRKVQLIRGILSSIKPGVNIKYAYKTIGKVFGVSGSTIAHIAHRRTWSEC